MVHRREIDGEAVVFGNHGALWGNAMTWWDHDTGSVWSQPTGESILGPLRGTKLELLPSTLTTWEAWRTSHPETEALDVHAWGTAFALEDMMIVVDFGDVATAYPVPFVRERGVVNDVVGGVPIAVVSDPSDPARWAVFSRMLDDATVDLIVSGDVIEDRASGTTFDPFLGLGRSGPLSAENLDKLAAFTIFPDDFPTFFPDGVVNDGS